MKDNPSPSPENSQPSGKIFYGWWILILGSLINGIGGGIIYHSFTVFFLPVKRDLAVSSAAISLLYGAARLEGGIDGPIYGYLIDRFGPRRIILLGTGLAGIGFILLSTVESFLGCCLIYLFTISGGMNACFYHPVSTVINRWFIRKRGIAFSVITASGSFGGMIMAPFLSYIILNHGWRNGALIAGLFILAIAVPAGIPIKRSPEAMGLHPDGQPPEGDGMPKNISTFHPPMDVHFGVREALRTFSFWILMTSISLRILVTMALNTHFVPLMVWRGMSEEGSAYLVSLAALSSIPMALALGWLGDRWDKAKLSCLCLLPTIVAMMGLIFFQGNTVLYLFPIAFSITYATAPLNWALIGDFFGRRSYATLRGIMGIGYGTATFISPLYAGWIFDRTNSYSIALWTFSAVLVICAVLFALLRRPIPSRLPNK
ncbi:MAG: MFS transporter [Deltaproteobacteria bacterium]|nr:MFS transporter [Deltaproteobacteria bacterium]